MPFYLLHLWYIEMPAFVVLYDILGTHLVYIMYALRHFILAYNRIT